MYFMLIAALIACNRRDGTSSEKKFVQGIKQEQKNQYDSALVCYLTAIEKLDTLDKNNFSTLGRYYNQTATLLFKSQLLDESEQMYKKAETLNSKLSDKSQLAQTYRGLWKCHYVKKQGSSDSTLLKTVPLIPYIKDKEELFKTKNTLSYYYLSQGKHNLALKYNTEIFGLLTDSVAHFKTCLVRSNIFMAIGNKDSSLFYAKEAMRSPYIFTRASACNNLFVLTKNNIWMSLEKTLNDSIEAMTKPSEISSTFYKQQIKNFNKNYASSIHKYTIITVTSILLAASSFFILALLLVRRRNSDGKRESPSQDKAVSSAENRDIELQRDIVSKILVATTKSREKIMKTNTIDQIKSIIEGGEQFLSTLHRQELFNAIDQYFILPRNQLCGYFSLSKEEYYFYCLSAMGMNTKECAACRGVSNSAIRVLRKRVNDKIRRIITNDTLFKQIKL